MLNKNKIINVLFVAVCSILYFYLDSLIRDTSFSYETKIDIVRPIYIFLPTLIALSASLILLPYRYFMKWLILIFSWFLPLSTYIIFTSERNRGEVFSSLSGPTFLAEMAGYALIFLTFVFVIAYTIIHWFLGRKTTKNTS